MVVKHKTDNASFQSAISEERVASYKDIDQNMR
jgi:hypothetical protein